jgi:hypothetical protein
MAMHIKYFLLALIKPSKIIGSNGKIIKISKYPGSGF